MALFLYVHRGIDTAWNSVSCEPSWEPQMQLYHLARDKTINLYIDSITVSDLKYCLQAVSAPSIWNAAGCGICISLPSRFVMQTVFIGHHWILLSLQLINHFQILDWRSLQLPALKQMVILKDLKNKTAIRCSELLYGENSKMCHISFVLHVETQESLKVERTWWRWLLKGTVVVVNCSHKLAC